MNIKNWYVVPVFLVMMASCDRIDQENKEATWAMQSFFDRQDVNPILRGDSSKFNCPISNEPVGWSENGVAHPAVVVRNNVVYMLLEAKDKAGTSRLGLSISVDGIKFPPPIGPLLYPGNDFMKTMEWRGGITNPRVVQNENGTYLLLYVARNDSSAVLCSATSTDFLNWVKNGPVFSDQPRQPITSATLLVRQEGERMVTQKRNGKYWMYFSGGAMYAASSEDLVHWSPVVEEGKLKPVFQPRPEYFDSQALECGPFALAGEEGIVLMYNGINEQGERKGGQVLLDSRDPTKIIHRIKDGHSFIKNRNTVTGLAYQNNSWKLYYSTEKGEIGLAMR